MDIELVDMEANGEENSNIKSLPKNSDSSKEQNNSNKKVNNYAKKKANNSCLITIIMIPIIVIFIITFIVLKVRNTKNDLIDNNTEINKGIVELTSNVNGTITIKKELLKNINSFIACLGQPGVGKSTFGSNYYKKLFKVKNDYFESSDSIESFTKGIWMITDEERRKIPEYISQDILDVEGFQIDNEKSWKYMMIIAFLSRDLIILNNQERYDEVNKMIKIIENSLKKMQEMKIPRILKRIFIQTIKSPKKQITIDQFLEKYNYDEKVFHSIKFQFIYLPIISNEDKEKEEEIMNYPKYKEKYETFLNLLNNSANKYDSVASLMNDIDHFNEAINENGLFNNQTIIEKIKTNFNSVYSRYEYKLKNSLYEKMENLTKFVKLGETFEDFILQINLTFEFKIKNEDLTYFGSCSSYDEIYENLKKKKTFRIEPKDIFYDFFCTEKLRLESQKNKSQQEIYSEYIKKKIEIDNYFSLLKFYQNIDDMDLELEIDNGLVEYKLERENDLKKYFDEEKKEKKKEWEDQIERAKWKTPVQSYGEMKCENGHELDDFVYCGKCNGSLYWVDSDEKYVICQRCNEVRKISDDIVCQGCGARALSHVKWIKGYKP